MVANIVFGQIRDRHGSSIITVRDQNVHDHSLRRKRLSTLLHVFVFHRYRAEYVHYLTPTDDNHRMAANLDQLEIFDGYTEEVGEIIVANIKRSTVKELASSDGVAMQQLITKA